MTIINGRKIAQEIIADLKLRPKPEKFMAAILVGDDPASANFINQKKKTAEELGIDFRLYNFAEELNNDELREEVGKIAGHGTCGGVIVQLPLPERINKNYILNVVSREKDVDVISERAIGAFYVGRNPVLPPAVGTVKQIVSTLNLELSTLSVAVVGLGFLIGKPVSVWLMDKAKELILLDKFSDLSAIKNADIVISGVGKAGLIDAKMLKDGASVIDFGYSITQIDADDTQINADKKTVISGDFDAEQLAISHKQLAFYTPTPGGTGPILVAKLFENFYNLNQ
ncbi:MAG TPA: bifunctional 5,10-methylenetetrahydrofolate dehydrogenase/5,10-methenyltetrahydrofolate cyclohydrolase [Candidatus Paceibacterota bacterium]|nr:bifunctional 5,10-methylenetetrahydrofolate dehydrogenase/5,10-methenyltetrahydrofolate cyclohydrolase [Candidatus Paceibacterota bacterium]